jgi:tetratricopeptide (TPR) repeat protein
MLIVIAFLVMMGKKMHNRSDGVFIDSRFKISLARFQIILWTVLTFSSFFTIALERNRLMMSKENLPQGFNPLHIQFPSQLLIALGISTASLAGSSIIKNVKKEKEGGKSIELLEDDKKKALFRQQESHKALLDAQDSIKKLNSEKNRLKAELDGFKENRDRLQKEVTETQAAADEAKKLLDKNPSDDAAKTAYGQALELLKTKQEALEKARAAHIISEKKYEAGLSGISEKTKAAVEKEESAKEDYSKYALEVNRVDVAFKNKEGLIHRNQTVKEANWIDMFRGDEVSNYTIVDVSKVQMFFFTIAIVCTYGVLIWSTMNPDQMRMATASFPTFSDTMNALLGLSHAGYLVVKTSG